MRRVGTVLLIIFCELFLAYALGLGRFLSEGDFPHLLPKNAFLYITILNSIAFFFVLRKSDWFTQSASGFISCIILSVVIAIVAWLGLLPLVAIAVRAGF